MPETVEPVSNQLPWSVCCLPGFALRFEYPVQTPTGLAVSSTQTNYPHMQVIHVHTPDRTTVYFEVAKVPQMDVEQLYEDVRSRNAQPNAELVIGSASEASLVAQAGLSFSLQRGELVRQVVLIQYRADTYRITYDPRSPLNLAILSTVAVVENGDVDEHSSNG